MFYVQYDESGNITGTVDTGNQDVKAPEHPRQLEFPVMVNTVGKKVDLFTGMLVDVPEPATELTQPE